MSGTSLSLGRKKPLAWRWSYRDQKEQQRVGKMCRRKMECLSL